MYTELPEKSEYSRREYAQAIERIARDGFSFSEKASSVLPLAKALGAPLDTKPTDTPTFSQEYVGRDEMCEIFRLRINAMPGLPFYGLMFVPHNAPSPVPLCIAAHGYLGTPELMYGMHGKNGYSGIIQRLLEKKTAVFAPQLLLWNCGFNPAKPHYETVYNRTELDKKLKAYDSGINALEIFCILRSIDALSKISALDLSELGVCGMSYGAFLTLRAMALDTRIRRGYFMSCFDGGLDPRFPEWRFRDGYRSFRDGELAAMCVPRKVFVEVGRYDDIFPPEGAEKEAECAASAYNHAGSEDSFIFNIWDGGHIVNPESPGVNFLTNV